MASSHPSPSSSRERSSGGRQKKKAPQPPPPASVETSSSGRGRKRKGVASSAEAVTAAPKSRALLSSPSPSSSEDEAAAAADRVPTPPTPHFGRAAQKKRSPTKSAAPSFASSRHRAKNVIVNEADAPTAASLESSALNTSGSSDLGNQETKKKAMSRIFGIKPSSSGGKGKGKGGKSGITVERAVKGGSPVRSDDEIKKEVEEDAKESKSNFEPLSSFPPPRRRAETGGRRPVLLCRIPLGLVPKGLDVRINLYRSRHHSRRPSGESVSSAGSKRSHRSSSSASSSKRKRKDSSRSHHKRQKTEEGEDGGLVTEAGASSSSYLLDQKSGGDPRAADPAYDASASRERGEAEKEPWHHNIGKFMGKTHLVPPRGIPFTRTALQVSGTSLLTAQSDNKKGTLSMTCGGKHSISK